MYYNLRRWKNTVAMNLSAESRDLFWPIRALSSFPLLAHLFWFWSGMIHPVFISGNDLHTSKRFNFCLGVTHLAHNFLSLSVITEKLLPWLIPTTFTSFSISKTFNISKICWTRRMLFVLLLRGEPSCH